MSGKTSKAFNLGRAVILRGHTAPANDCVFLKRSPLLFSVGDDDSVRTFDVVTGSHVRSVFANQRVDLPYIKTLAVNGPEAMLAATCVDLSIRVWDVDSGKLQCQCVYKGEATSCWPRGVAFDPIDTNSLMFCAEDRTLRHWDTRGKAASVFGLLGAGAGGAWRIKYSPDGQRFVVTSADGVFVFDRRQGQPLNVVAVLQGHDDYVYGACFSSPSTVVFPCSAHHLAEFDINNSRCLWSARGSDFSTLRAVVCGTVLAAAGGGCVVRVFDPSSKKMEHDFKGHAAPIFSLALSPDGQSIASASDDCTVRIWPLHQLLSKRTPNKAADDGKQLPTTVVTPDKTPEASQPRHSLTHAAALADVETVQSLMKAGARPEAQDHKGDSALHSNCTSTVLRLLVTATPPPNVNIRNGSGRTPLHAHVGYSSADNIEQLLSAGADANAKDNDGITPLMLAVQNGNLALVSLLLGPRSEAIWNGVSAAVLFSRRFGAVGNVLAETLPMLSLDVVGVACSYLFCWGDPFLENRRGQTALTIPGADLYVRSAPQCKEVIRDRLRQLSCPVQIDTTELRVNRHVFRNPVRNAWLRLIEQQA